MSYTLHIQNDNTSATACGKNFGRPKMKHHLQKLSTTSRYLKKIFVNIYAISCRLRMSDRRTFTTAHWSVSIFGYSKMPGRVASHGGSPVPAVAKRKRSSDENEHRLRIAMAGIMYCLPNFLLLSPNLTGMCNSAVISILLCQAQPCKSDLRKLRLALCILSIWELIVNDRL